MKSSRKKLLCGILTVCMAGATVGCGANGQNENSPETGEQLVQQVLDVPEEIEYFDTIAVQDENMLLAVGCQENGMDLWSYDRQEDAWQKHYSITELLTEQGLSINENLSVTTALSQEGTLFVTASQWTPDGSDVTESCFYAIADGRFRN